GGLLFGRHTCTSSYMLCPNTKFLTVSSRVVSISNVSAPQHGVVFSAKSLDHPERAFKEAARLYEMGALDLRIEQTFSLGEVANAQAISAAGRVTGKLVITLA
ncbi:zinc-binding dehydrogenase, partial [Pseudomonas savastanoi]